jgi:hypothetical protein
MVSSNLVVNLRTESIEFSPVDQPVPSLAWCQYFSICNDLLYKCGLPSPIHDWLHVKVLEYRITYNDMPWKNIAHNQSSNFLEVEPCEYICDGCRVANAEELAKEIQIVKFSTLRQLPSS